MSEQHTPTPWTISAYGNVERDHETIRVSGFALSGGSEAKSSTRRIVACVNACEGISTNHLEEYGLPGFARKISDLQQQRDELLAAAKVLLDKLTPMLKTNSSFDQEFSDVCRAIAKAES